MHYVDTFRSITKHIFRLIWILATWEQQKSRVRIRKQRASMGNYGRASRELTATIEIGAGAERRSRERSLSTGGALVSKQLCVL